MTSDDNYKFKKLYNNGRLSPRKLLQERDHANDCFDDSLARVSIGKLKK